MQNPESLERLTQSAQNAAVRLHVRSALNPLLWLCGICTPIALVLAKFSSGAVQFFLLILAALPIVCACVAYFYWMLKAPSRLHSEDYQLRHEALELIREKGTKGGILASSVIAITNPSLAHLEDKNQ